MSSLRKSLSLLGQLDLNVLINRASTSSSNRKFGPLITYLSRTVTSTTTPPAEDPLRQQQGSSSTTPGPSTDAAAAAAQQALIEAELRAELTKVCTEAASLKSKTQEFEDKYKRALADSENLRNRLTKQIQDQKLYAIQGFCKDLTDIEDILRLAIDSVPKSETDKNKHLKELYEGLTMTEARLLQVFKRHGLTQLNPINDKFNPNEHEAVMQKEEEGKESGTVLFVSKLGYKLHDRVIRPAVVGVAK